MGRCEELAWRGRIQSRLGRRAKRTEEIGRPLADNPPNTMQRSTFRTPFRHRVNMKCVSWSKGGGQVTRAVRL